MSYEAVRTKVTQIRNIIDACSPLSALDLISIVKQEGISSGNAVFTTYIPIILQNPDYFMIHGIIFKSAYLNKYCEALGLSTKGYWYNSKRVRLSAVQLVVDEPLT